MAGAVQRLVDVGRAAAAGRRRMGSSLYAAVVHKTICSCGAQLFVVGPGNLKKLLFENTPFKYGL